MTNWLLFICADFVNFNPVIKGGREVTLRTTVLKEDKGGKQSESYGELYGSGSTLLSPG